MESRKRAIVTVETRSVSVIRPASEAIELWCQDCAAIVPMVTPECAAQLERTTVRAVYRRVEQGALHYEESDNGQLMICCRLLVL